MEILREHPDNEHWWEVKCEGEEIGFVPSSYIIIKDQQALPWLQEAALKSEEEERKVRVMRLKQQQSAMDGTGFGPLPRDLSSLPAKVELVGKCIPLGGACWDYMVLLLLAIVCAFKGSQGRHLQLQELLSPLPPIFP